MEKEIKLYGEIGCQITATGFVNTLSELEQNGYTHLTIHLHSAGGDVIEGNAIFNAIQQTPIHVKIVIDGLAGSMASIIILAADEVEICENAFIMIHRPSGGGGGTADDVDATAKVLRDMEQAFARSIAAKTGMTTNEVQTKFLNGSDCWLNADEALQYGFATRKIAAIANIKDLKPSAKMDVTSIYSRFSASLNNDNQTDMRKKLIEKFNLEGLTDESTDDEVIEKLVEKFSTLEKQAEQNNEESINALLFTARQEGKITALQEQTYKQIGVKNGIAALTEVLGNIRIVPSITAMLQAYNQKTPEAKEKDRKDWTLDDYRKHAPNELRANPKLYAKLVDQQFGKQ